MGPLVASVLRVIALVVLVFFFLLAAPPAVARSAQRFIAGMRAPDLEARRRAELGDAWVDAIDQIRRVIPPDGSYLLASGDRGAATAYWVRYELAPRRARFLGPLD